MHLFQYSIPDTITYVCFFQLHELEPTKFLFQPKSFFFYTYRQTQSENKQKKKEQLKALSSYNPWQTKKGENFSILLKL